tara:strand:- start:129 stop:419 length:291 start_codon:yes stop_codon:yes gene_type:complete
MIYQYRLYSRVKGWENIDIDIPDERYYNTKIIKTSINLESFIGKCGNYIYTTIKNNKELYNQNQDTGIKTILEYTKQYPYFYLYPYNIRFGAYTKL